MQLLTASSARGAPTDAERFGQRIIGVDETAHRELRGFAPTLVSADAVGNCGNDIAAYDAVLAEADGDVVLIGRSFTGLARETDTNPEISLRTRGHAQDLPSLRSSDARSRHGAPGGAPADLDHGKSQEPKQRQESEEQEACTRFA